MELIFRGRFAERSTALKRLLDNINLNINV